MRKFFKWLGFILGGLILIALAGLLAMYIIVQNQRNRVYEIAVTPVAIPTGEAAIERGKRVAWLGFCQGCHGEDWSGDYFDEGPLVGALKISNLTSGEGGVGREYSDNDWVRAIRHGVDREGHSVFGMDSSIYYNLSDADLGALIAYLKTVPPVDRVHPETRLGPMAMCGVLMAPQHFLPAQFIPHNAARPADIAPSVSADYGRYLASLSCQSCHGSDMAGGGNAWAGVNLTPGGEIGSWTEEDFFRALRTGDLPDGRELDPEMMPWRETAKLSDEELRALWLYLQSLPPIISTPTPAP